MRLRGIAVTGLYGIFDHEISLDKPEGVTIIHGPNGYGKTVMLKMISAALEGDVEIFRSTPFKEFKIEFADGSTWRAVREFEKSKDSGPRINVRIVTISAEGVVTEVEPDPEEDIAGPLLDAMDSSVPSPYHRSGKGWRDEEGRYYSVQQILRMFPSAGDRLPPSARRQLKSRPPWDLKLDVFVVEANRLESSRQFETEDPRIRRQLLAAGGGEAPRPLRVQQYSRDVVQRIRSVLADYAKSSQERDRTFPERLVQFVRQENKMLGEREILEQMQDLEKKRQRLITLGFLDPETGLRDLTEEEVRKAQEALTIYVGDVHQKLNAFDEMAQRVGKLIDIINARFEYKKLKIHRERGFCVVSHKGAPIQLSDLSSGEQHELVVLYELLFRTPKHGLILVDEPEISLHVAWQSRFLADLIDIVKLNDAYAVVATHSPVVIGSQWNLTEQLKGPSSREEAEPAQEMHAVIF